MSYSNIAICSYNLNWEIMDYSNGNLINQYTIDELKLFKSNIISSLFIS